MKHTLVTLFVSLCAAAPAAADVLVVRPGGTYPEIQTAVDAASDGDTILVRSGTYGSVSIVDKDLSILAQPGHAPFIGGSIEVRDLAAGKAVLLADLTVEALDVTQIAQANGVYVHDCAGSVRVQACALIAAGSTTWGVSANGARVENSPDVAFVRCTLFGSTAGGALTAGGSGTRLIGSEIALYDSASNGAPGSSVSQSDTDAGPGGDGCALTSSFAFVSNSNLSGGTGGSSSAPSCSCANDGGSALRLAGASTVHALDDVLAAGAGGTDASSSCGACGSCDDCPGEPGAVIVGAGVTTISGSGRTLNGNTFVHERDSLSLSIGGRPGDVVALGMSTRAGFQFAPAQRGVMLLRGAAGQPVRFQRLGSVGPDGQLTVTLPAPALASGVSSRRVFLQAMHTSPNGQVTLGSPLSLVVVSD